MPGLPAGTAGAAGLGETLGGGLRADPQRAADLRPRVAPRLGPQPGHGVHDVAVELVAETVEVGQLVQGTVADVAAESPQAPADHGHVDVLGVAHVGTIPAHHTT